MKTLVIHPADKSTEFLKEIYVGKDWTINNDFNGSRKKVIEQIKEHDRIIMMGHGCPSGLFYTPIRPDLVYLLREKELIFVWCNADKFVLQYGLKGFTTHMFCSEYSECYYVGINGVKDGMVEESNNAFATIMSKYIDQNLNVIHEKVTQEYGVLGEVNPVAAYNNERLSLVL
jgi:hypothetical protein